MTASRFHSAIYSGVVSHTRFSPKRHHFKYQVFMMYLDLEELEEVFSLSVLWSKDNKFTPARFKRQDFLGGTEVALDLAETGLNCVEVRTIRNIRNAHVVELLVSLLDVLFLMNGKAIHKYSKRFPVVLLAQRPQVTLEVYRIDSFLIYYPKSKTP